MTTLDKILTGNLEADIKYAIERVSGVLPDGAEPTVIINASTRPGNCFVAMEVVGMDGLSFFGADTIREAAEGLVKKITNPELLNEKRKELQSKIAELQAKLDSIPAGTSKSTDETPVSAPAAPWVEFQTAS